MRLLWLPDVLREAGLTVHEYPGWRDRGREDWGPVRGVICHATAGSRSSTVEGETRTLWVTGSSSAPAPISQLFLARSGEWTVGASGRCNHVLVGDKGPHQGFGNSALVGVEAQNDNRGEPWSPVMTESYQRGVAAVLRRLGLPASRAAAHAEHQSGKSDPLGINMISFRQQVAEWMEDDMPTADEVAREVLHDARFRRADAAVRPAGEQDISLAASVEWARKHAADAKTGVGELRAELAGLRGEVSGLATLVGQLAHLGSAPLTPDQLGQLVAEVRAAAAAPAAELAAALAAAGEALAAADDES